MQILSPWRIITSLRRKRRSEEHTSELQSRLHLVCRFLLGQSRAAPRSHRHSRVRPAAPCTTPPCAAPSRPGRAITAPPPACTCLPARSLFFIFFNDTAPTEIYTLSLHTLFRS